MQQQQTTDPLASFLRAMTEAGIPPHNPADIVPDGGLHRFRVAGDKSDSRNGFALLHLDGLPAGYFGSWKVGVSETWCAKSSHHMTPAEREANHQRIKSAKERAERIRMAEQAEAARRAVAIWNRAKPASEKHAYLVRKGITPGNARQDGEALILPIVGFDGRITSLQFIQPDGSKRLLSGGKKAGAFITASEGATAKRVIICEGWATGRTLAAADPDAIVLSAIDAGNLEKVATQARQCWRNIDLVIACDNDRITPDNPGMTKGRAAAIAAGARLMVPEFPDDAPANLSDFNDLAAWLAGGAQ